MSPKSPIHAPPTTCDPFCSPAKPFWPADRRFVASLRIRPGLQVRGGLANQAPRRLHVLPLGLPLADDQSDHVPPVQLGMGQIDPLSLVDLGQEFPVELINL